jgi:hypothetical protein
MEIKNTRKRNEILKFNFTPHLKEIIKSNVLIPGMYGLAATTLFLSILFEEKLKGFERDVAIYFIATLSLSGLAFRNTLNGYKKTIEIYRRSGSQNRARRFAGKFKENCFKKGSNLALRHIAEFEKQYKKLRLKN